jgi:hypothetical protein
MACVEPSMRDGALGTVKRSLLLRRNLMRSLRLAGTMFSAMATIAAHAASAQTPESCGPLSMTPAYATRSADCQTSDVARLGAELLFGNWFGSSSGTVVRAGTGTGFGVEYYTGGPSLDVFRTALAGSVGRDPQNDDPFTSIVSQTATTLLWESLFAAGPQTWSDIGRAEAVSVLASVAGVGGVHPPDIFVQAVTPASPVFGNTGPSTPTGNAPPDVRSDAPGTGVQTPVSSTPEPGSIALLATGLLGLGGLKARFRRRG